MVIARYGVHSPLPHALASCLKRAWQRAVNVIVRPLSTVEYTSVASVFHCRRGLANLIHDRRGCTLFTLSSVDTSACSFHAGANGRVGYDTLTHSRLYSRDREKK